MNENDKENYVIYNGTKIFLQSNMLCEKKLVDNVDKTIQQLVEMQEEKNYTTKLANFYYNKRCNYIFSTREYISFLKLIYCLYNDFLYYMETGKRYRGCNMPDLTRRTGFHGLRIKSKLHLLIPVFINIHNYLIPYRGSVIHYYYLNANGIKLCEALFPNGKNTYAKIDGEIQYKRPE